MGKSKDLATGNSAAYVETAGDTMSGALNVGTASGTQPSYFNSFLNVQNNASTSDHASVTITSGTGGYAGLHFGDSANGRIGQVAYNNADDSLLFTAGNSTRMTINSSGRVTMPYQPYFRVTMKYISSGGWNGLAQTLDSAGYWNNPTDNVGSHWSSSTGRFTAPVAGKYLFTFNMRYDSFSGSYFYIDMRQNGSMKSRSLKSEGGNYLMGDVSHILNMAVNDYMDIKVFSIGDSSVALNSDSFLSGMLLG